MPVSGAHDRGPASTLRTGRGVSFFGGVRQLLTLMHVLQLDVQHTG